MSASSRILSELAEQERALSAELESARQEAARVIEAARQEASRILQEAQEKAAEMARENARRLADEQGRIRETERSSAQTSVQSELGGAQGRLGQAVDLIVKAVLP